MGTWLRLLTLAGVGAALCLLLVSWPPPAAALQACRISEFPCKTNKCVRLDQYCDGRDDCGDKSDEPSHCTVCNRTYYGDVGKTYTLLLQKPPLNRIPFNCHITFTASGHSHGELIQLLFDQFHVGRFDEGAVDTGCPDGHMQLSELGRPFTGGFWCGASSGYAVYFSETETVTLSLRLFPSLAHTFLPFHFQLRYRFIMREDAVVRFGSQDKPVERGQTVPGTYCSRIFDDCYRRKCKLQSPNYPGMYPRNVTCYLNLRQRQVPNCKHAMISVHQDSEHKVQMKRAISTPASFNKTGRAVRVWDDCPTDRDHLVFYDGPSVNDPVLVKWCGGDWLPRVASRGPEMLVAFHSSPFSVPLHTLAPPKSPLRGFELEVDIIFSDSDSLDYQRDPRKCEFWINATDWGPSNAVNQHTPGHVGQSVHRWGHILSPRHTLPPNTTCTYHFRGQPGDKVWLYFLAYSHHSLMTPSAPGTATAPAPPTSTTTPVPPPSLPPHLMILPPPNWPSGLRFPSGSSASVATQPTSCSTRLRIWDGGGTSGFTLLAAHCDLDGPRLCAHAALGNASRTTRSCGPHESYESTGTELTMQHTSTEGTALHPAHFRLRYEFVDTELGGDHWARGALMATGAVSSAGRPLARSTIPCARLFNQTRSGEVMSPRNVFMYGRGGAANLSCIYRIEAPRGEKIRLTIHRAAFGEDSAGSCSTVPEPHTGRPTCMYSPHSRTSELRLWEVPWREVRLPRVCLCDNSSFASQPFIYQSVSKVLEITFTFTNLNVTEDYNNLYFYSSFEMVRGSECSRKQRLRGSGGELEFASPPMGRMDINCDGLPWMLEAHENMSLFLLTWGNFLPVSGPLEEGTPSRCHTKSRILLYTGRPVRLLRVVCPLARKDPHFAIHVFSEEWLGTSASQQLTASAGSTTYTSSSSLLGRAPSFLVEWVGKDSSFAALHWLEISKPKSALQQRLWSEEGIQATPEAPRKQGNATALPTWDCPYKCPELNACISETLWCDGRPNCPSGFDERDGLCNTITFLSSGLYVLMASAGAGIGILVLLLSVLIIALRLRATRRRRHLLSKKDGVLGSTVGTLSSVASSGGGSLPGTYRRNKTRRRSDGTGRRLSGVDGDAIANQPRRIPTSELLLDANS